MKHAIALILALVLSAMCFCAAAEAFTPITVDGSNYLTNIDNCIASIDQTTLDTDETFSFNRVVGQRTEERGYCTAPNGRGVDVVGGGVAQVASAIWLLIRDRADVVIVEKSTYGSAYNQTYVSSSADAIAVDYASDTDFSFRYTGSGSLTLYVVLDADAHLLYAAVG